ncbi:MAG: metal-dependent hydrolase [Candidatus Bathyarchaeia archaeon]
MFAVGHLALGYIVGKASSRILNLRMSIPLIFVFAILPDIDLLTQFLRHRGPTHSIIVVALISTPFLIRHRKRAIPYLLVIAQHSLIGDFLVGSVQLFWPVNMGWFGFGIPLLSLTNKILEWVFFSASLLLMVKTKDLYSLLKPHPHNLLLILPATTTILPIAGSLMKFNINVPVELVVPHIIYTIIFILPILIAAILKITNL